MGNKWIATAKTSGATVIAIDDIGRELQSNIIIDYRPGINSSFAKDKRLVPVPASP